MVDTVERERLQAYMKKHNIEEIIQKLVEGLLKDRPEVTPKEHWAHMLRLEKIKREHKDETSYISEASVASEVPGRLLSRLFEATKRITSEIMPQETIKLIIGETIDLLACDRVSLFIFDKRLNMLKLNASNLDVPIRVKPGQGIAGHVFTEKETINIPDCYKDDRFDQTFDKMTGYRTNNLLTMPIIDFEGECLGVLQAINKLPSEENTDPHFNHVDEIILENLTQHVSVCLRNAELYMAAIVTSERSMALVSMIQSLSQNLGAQSTILSITMHANQLVQADRCTVFLVDEGKQQLQSVCGDSGKEIRIPKTAGLAGQCCTECNLICIEDCYQDSRFNQAIDKQTGYKTTSMLVVPVLRKHNKEGLGSVLAVIQMINKMEFDGEVGRFDEDDMQMMETCATFIATKLENSSMLEKISHTKKKDSEGMQALGDVDENSFRSGDRLSGKSPKRQQSGGIVEGSITEEDETGMERQVTPTSQSLRKSGSKRHSVDCETMKESAEEDPGW